MKSLKKMKWHWIMPSRYFQFKPTKKGLALFYLKILKGKEGLRKYLHLSTPCPGSSDPILYSKLLHKMGHYFLDIQYFYEVHLKIDWKALTEKLQLRSRVLVRNADRTILYKYDIIQLILRQLLPSKQELFIFQGNSKKKSRTNCP